MPNKRIKIARTGTFTEMRGRKVTFDQDFLQSLADSYNPSLRSAPLVKGHPRIEDPAYGWVEGLSCEDDGLYALVGKVDPDFAADVNAGRWANVSPEIYLAGAAGNPDENARPYLRHVGFLGAAQPAMSGLGTAALSGASAEDGVARGPIISLSEESVLSGWRVTSLGRSLVRLVGFLKTIAPDGKDAAALDDLEREATSLIEDGAAASERAWQENKDVALSAPTGHSAHGSDESSNISTTERGEGMDKDELKAATDQLAADRVALAAEQKALAEEKQVLRKGRQAARIDALETAGKLVPAQRELVASLAAALPEGDGVVSFAQGDEQKKQSAEEAFFTLLEGLPERVSFGEAAPVDGREVADVDSVEGVISAANALVKAEAARGNNIDYEDAVARVTANQGDAT